MQPQNVLPRLKESTTALSAAAYLRLSDMDLVRKANTGDRRALETLVERYSPRVQRIASRLLDLEDARDAAQEALVKLCTRLKQFRGDAQFSTWLHRLVVNTCSDFLARQRLRRMEALPELECAATDEGDPSRAALLSELRRDVLRALARLSREQRAVVLLRDGLGLPYEEVARVARIPVGTAKCYVHRARTRLQPALEEHALT